MKQVEELNNEISLLNSEIDDLWNELEDDTKSHLSKDRNEESLSEGESVEELARMLGGARITGWYSVKTFHVHKTKQDAQVQVQ